MQHMGNIIPSGSTSEKKSLTCIGGYHLQKSWDPTLPHKRNKFKAGNDNHSISPNKASSFKNQEGYILCRLVTHANECDGKICDETTMRGMEYN